MINSAGVFIFLLFIVPFNYWCGIKFLNSKRWLFNFILFLNLFFTIYFYIAVYFLFYKFSNGAFNLDTNYSLNDFFTLNNDLVVMVFSGLGQILIMLFLFSILFRDEYKEKKYFFLMAYSAPVLLFLLLKIMIDYF